MYRRDEMIGELKGVLLCLCIIAAGTVNSEAALDLATRIELRNSLKQLELCMTRTKSDISQCLQELNLAISRHKSVLRNSDNAEVREQLLALVNHLHQTAELYYSHAEKLEDSNHQKRIRYYGKAAVCYLGLSKLYKKRGDFIERYNICQIQSSRLSVVEALYELNSTTDLNKEFILLQKVKNRLKSYEKGYGVDKSLGAATDSAVGATEKRIQTLFQKCIDFRLLCVLTNLEQFVVEFRRLEKHEHNLVRMQEKVVGVITETVSLLKKALDKAEAAMKSQDYTRANALYAELLENLKTFPNLTLAYSGLRNKISKATGNFDVVKITRGVKQKGELAANTSEYFQLLSNGNAHQKKNSWIEARRAFAKAYIYQKNNVVDERERELAAKLFNGTVEQIKELDDTKINKLDVASIKYDAIGLDSWWKGASKGKFSTKPVAILGTVQQKVGKVFILKKGTLDLNFLGNIGGSLFDKKSVELATDYKYNSCGVIFKDDRLLQADAYVRCLGIYHGRRKFENALGGEIEIPIFKVLFSE